MVGIVVPILPGLPLMMGVVLVWAFLEGTAVAWVAFTLILAVGIAATVIKYLIPGQKLKDSGVPTSTMLIAVVGAVVGFFVIPVIGAPIGFVVSIYLMEWSRVGVKNAWPATLKSAGAVALSIGIELAGALAIFGIWLVAVIFG